MAVKRWTDEMLDNLAGSVSKLGEDVSELRESVGELRESVGELRESVGELRESVGEVKDSVDGIRITAQALLQIAAQNQSRMDRFDEEMASMKQRQAESDQRFNILLEEVRYLIRGKNQNDEGNTL